MAGKTIKLDVGTIYKKTDNGSYFFRYQINGQRKAVSLKTKNQQEAIKKAQELLPVVKATTTEVISAHVKQAKGWLHVNSLYHYLKPGKLIQSIPNAQHLQQSANKTHINPLTKSL